jgi:hypothetical protein
VHRPERWAAVPLKPSKLYVFEKGCGLYCVYRILGGSAADGLQAGFVTASSEALPVLRWGL